MGIDMGTSGCKAVVFDSDWKVVSQAYREYPMHFPGEGLLELDAELVWERIREVIREANEKAAVPVVAIAVSAIGDVIIPLDEQGKSIRYSIVDFDARGGVEIQAFAERFGRQRFFNVSGDAAAVLRQSCQNTLDSKSRAGCIQARISLGNV